MTEPQPVAKPPEVWEAERAKLEAEAEAARAKARVDSAAAAEGECDARKAAIALEKVEREYSYERCKDDYHHVYSFTTSVSGSSAETCIRTLRSWLRMEKDIPKKQKTPIEIVFQSPGGEVIAGMALFDVIQQVRAAGHHVTTSTIGYAASMAGILLQAGDKRIMGRECPTLDQPVLMEDLSWKSAVNLEVGDRILSVAESSGVPYRSWEPATVQAVGRAVRPCSLVRLADGSEFTASNNHGWLTRGGNWVRTKNLNTRGAGPSRVKRLLDVHKPLPDWDAGWMAGILDGEGCLYGERGGQNLRVGIVQVEGLLLNEIKLWLDIHGFKYYIHRTEGTDRHQPRQALAILGGLEENIRLLALTRPKRLLAKLPGCINGMRLTGNWIPVDSVSSIGNEEVVRLATSSSTYVGGGVAQHNSYILIHEVSSGAMGKTSEIEDEVAFLKKIQGRVIQIFVSRSKLSRATIERKWRRKDWWIDSTEALKLGLVDEVR